MNKLSNIYASLGSHADGKGYGPKPIGRNQSNQLYGRQLKPGRPTPTCIYVFSCTCT